VLGDNSAFKTIDKDTATFPGSGQLDVGVSTNHDTNYRFRFDAEFQLEHVSTDLNGGWEFNDKSVTRAELQKASNC
jgi:hypothetical protein